MYDNISNIWLFLAAALFVSGLAVYASHFRDIPGARQYALHKSAITLLLLSLTMASVANGLAVKILWIKFYYAGIFIAVLAWLALALQLTGHGKLLNRWTVTGALVALAAGLLLLFTNEWHGLYWSHVWMEGNDPRASNGPVCIAILSIGYMILLVSTVLFFRRFMVINGILRTQAGIIIFSTCITVAGHFCWRFAPVPELRQDLLAVAFIISGFLDAFALFRLRMFDIMSIAQTVVIKTMGDGLVALDNHGLIVGLNSSAERMIGKSSQEASGDYAEKIFEPWPELIDLIRKENEETAEIIINQQYYAVLSTFLSGSNLRKSGKALVFHNITAEKTAQELLLEQQQAVAVSKERDRLGRELHDGQGQLLGYFQMQLEAARSLIAKGRPGQAEPLLKRLVELTQGLHADIRESITGLKTDAYEEGFLHTLNDYVRWFSYNYGIKADLILVGEFKDEMFSPVAVVQLQRIIQEAMANGRRHAGARQIQITIQVMGDTAEITVEDDGTGFDFVKAMAKKGSYGLHIMQERAAEIGADLSFDTGAEAGTRVRIRVPVKTSKKSFDFERMR